MLPIITALLIVAPFQPGEVPPNPMPTIPVRTSSPLPAPSRPAQSPHPVGPPRPVPQRKRTGNRASTGTPQ